MRKGRDGGEKVKNEMKKKKRKKIMAEIVATTSLPVDRLTATDCNAAARVKIKTFLVATNVVASRPPEGRPTATPTIVQKKTHVLCLKFIDFHFYAAP